MIWGTPEYTRTVDLCTQYLRSPSGFDDATGSLVFTPPLTTAEQASFADLQTMARFGVNLTLTEWQSIKADVASLKTYNGLNSPTLAQTVAATKAQNRILAVIIRS